MNEVIVFVRFLSLFCVILLAPLVLIAQARCIVHDRKYILSNTDILLAVSLLNLVVPYFF